MVKTSQDSQTSTDNDPYLDQLVTPKTGVTKVKDSVHWNGHSTVCKVAEEVRISKTVCDEIIMQFTNESHCDSSFDWQAKTDLNLFESRASELS